MPPESPATAPAVTLPEAFSARMKAMLGEDFEAFCASYAKPVRPSLRVNTGKLASPDDLRDMVSFMGEPVPWQETGFYCRTDGGERPGKHPFHEAGLYYIQEASAMLPASLCPPKPGERVLDLCAAPGGKATQLAAALQGEGLLIANEIHPTRATILSQNIERMGVRNAIVTNASPAELAERFPAFFDKIVVDAPCSGEGMFRKEADAVAMWSEENVALCAARQTEILDLAAGMLRAGGYLVYSTCTFAPAENEGVVLEFLRRHPDFSVVSSEAPAVIAAREAGLIDGGHPEWLPQAPAYPAANREAVRLAYRILPHHTDGEGHFAVLLHRSAGDRECLSALPKGSKKSKSGKGKGSLKDPMAARDETAFSLFFDFARDTLGGPPAWIADMVPCLFGDKLSLVPACLLAETEQVTGAAVRQRLSGLRVLRAGVCAGTVAGQVHNRPGRFEPDHALAMATVPHGLTAVFPVEDRGLTPLDAAVTYLRGETLPAPDRRGWHIVTYGGYPLGWGKASDGVMKNHYPKGLRRN